jgi:hypothetical protein
LSAPEDVKGTPASLDLPTDALALIYEDHFDFV